MDRKMQEALDSVPPEPLAGRTKFWKGFLYGEYGVGKTKVTGDCIDKKGLVIATDTGAETYYNHPDLVDKIEVVPYTGLSQVRAIAEAVTEGYGKYKEFDLISVDTISQIQEEYLDWLNDNFTFTGDHRTRAMVRPEAKRADSSLKDVEIIGLPDYHLAKRNMSPIIKALVKAPINVMFVAHLREPTFMEQQKGKLVRRPTLTETVFKIVAREASFMGLMEREGPKRTIQFMTDKKTVSKSRIAELDDKKINADELGTILKNWSKK